MTPLEFIAAVRDIYPERYMDGSGGCLKFHNLLRAVFPEARGYYNSDHVITEIDGDFYDIDGLVEQYGGYAPIEEFGNEHIESSFGEYLSANLTQ